MIFLATLLFCAQVPDKQLVPLEVQSDYIARKPPITITATPDPSVANFDWIVPPLVKATKRDNTLEVTYAPPGEVVIELIETVGEIVDNKIMYTKRYGRAKFFVAGVEPAPVPPIPPGPGPGPAPVDPFVAIFQAAYTADLDPNKAANTVSLAGLYNVSSTKVLDTTYVATAGDVYSKMKAASFNLKLSNKIITVRTSVQVELDKILPRTPATVLDSAMRELFSTTFKRVELALGQCK